MRGSWWSDQLRERSGIGSYRAGRRVSHSVNAASGRTGMVTEIFGSPNRFRTQDLLVNSQGFETLCLRVFSAFCDLLALSALGTDGASEGRGCCTGLVPLKVARRLLRSYVGRLRADRLRSTRPAPAFAALRRLFQRSPAPIRRTLRPSLEPNGAAHSPARNIIERPSAGCMGPFSRRYAGSATPVLPRPALHCCP